jgi:hypothetical protein
MNVLLIAQFSFFVVGSPFGQKGAKNLYTSATGSQMRHPNP